MSLETPHQPSGGDATGQPCGPLDEVLRAKAEEWYHAQLNAGMTASDALDLSPANMPRDESPTVSLLVWAEYMGKFNGLQWASHINREMVDQFLVELAIKRPKGAARYLAGWLEQAEEEADEPARLSAIVEVVRQAVTPEDAAIDILETVVDAMYWDHRRAERIKEDEEESTDMRGNSKLLAALAEAIDGLFSDATDASDADLHASQAQKGIEPERVGKFIALGLRELKADTAGLMEVVDNVVQSAMELWDRLETKHFLPKHEAQDEAFESMLCPSPPEGPLVGQLPIAEREWELILASVNSFEAD